MSMAMNGVLWVTEHKGKMKGIRSIGTSCVNNPWCIKRRENGESVCAKCYAQTYMKIRKKLKQRLSENADILTIKLLSEREIPFINDLIFRFESFGDLYNTIHLENYLLICNKNPFTNFGLWTKNTWILDEVFNEKRIKKPENLSVVASSPILNKQVNLDMKKYWFVDHVFTVYDKQFIVDNNVNVNCGAKSCLECRLCYHKGEFYVREKLK